MKIVGPAAAIAFVLIVANSCDNAQTRRTSSATNQKPAAVKQASADQQAAARKRAAQRKAAAERKKAAERKAAAERRRKAQAKKDADEAARRKAEEAKKKQAAAPAPNEPAPNQPAPEANAPQEPQPAPVEAKPVPNQGMAAARKLPVGQCPGQLTFGQQGGDVYMLQAALVARGFPTETDGRFGSETRQSVKNIQERRSLPPTGKVNDAVWQALGRC